MATICWQYPTSDFRQLNPVSWEIFCQTKSPFFLYLIGNNIYHKSILTSEQYAISELFSFKYNHVFFVCSCVRASVCVLVHAALISVCPCSCKGTRTQKFDLDEGIQRVRCQILDAVKKLHLIFVIMSDFAIWHQAQCSIGYRTECQSLSMVYPISGA